MLQSGTPANASDQADARKLASHCFTRAGEAVRQGQYDYAIQLYRGCCAYMPESIIFRQALRETVKRKLGQHPPRRTIRRLWAVGMIRRARLRRDDRRLIEACEQALSYNPWNKKVLLQQARACARLGYEQLAVWDLESVLELDPEHPKAARELAHLYERQGAYEKAARLWTLLRRQNPNDTEARERWRATQEGIAEQLGQAPNEPAEQEGNGEDVMALLTLPRRETSKAIEPAAAPPSPETQLERRVAEDPTDVEQQLELARQCQENGDFDRARRVLLEALQISGGDLRVREQWENLEAEVLRERVRKARQWADDQPDDEATQNRVKALEIEVNDYELDLYRRRAERYPNRSDLKYEFGVRLSRAGLLDEAILQLTAALKSPQHRLRAAVLMGDCLASQGQRLRARRCYEQALQIPSAWDEPLLLDEARRRLDELGDD